jgi:hypothetical protein
MQSLTKEKQDDEKDGVFGRDGVFGGDGVFSDAPDERPAGLPGWLPNDQRIAKMARNE